MGRLKLFLPLAAFVLIAIFLQRGLHNDPTALPSALVGQPFPAFSLSELQDEKRTLQRADLPNELFLVNVWATWCYACRIEHAMLNELASKGVRIIGLNYKDERNAARKWLADRGNPYEFTLFDLQGELGLNLGVYGAPETYLVDGQGIVQHRRVGVIDERVWAEQFAPFYKKAGMSGQ